MTAHKLFCEEEKKQKPARSGAAGVLSTLAKQARAGVRAGRLPRAEAPLVCHRPAARQPQPLPSSPQPAISATPTLQHITLEDLRDTGRVLTLYAQAREKGLIGQAEADRLTFVALAHHVLLYRPDNPGGLFHRLLTHRLFHYVTQEDEDQALQRLKAYDQTHGYACVMDHRRAGKRAAG